MIPLYETLLLTLATTTGIMAALWVVSLWKRDASIVDPAWGAGFVVVAALAWWWNQPADARATLLLVLTSLWGARLSLFLLWRNWGQGEDRRYRAMREHHGPRFWWVSLLTVFGLQAVLLWFISWPMQVAMAAGDATKLGWLDAVGLLAWSTGLFFETVGDWQLARFQAEESNAGRVLDRGLWRYTRHPNYFGDFCVWWGLYLIAASGGAWWTIASPLLMSVLLLKVSGVTLLERTITTRRPEYAEYQRRTNAFFPGRPRGGLPS